MADKETTEEAARPEQHANIQEENTSKSSEEEVHLGNQGIDLDKLADEIEAQARVEAKKRQDNELVDEDVHIAIADTPKDNFVPEHLGVEIANNPLYRIKKGKEVDKVAGRYAIQLKQQLSELSSPFAKAYRVQDIKSKTTEELYALVFEPGYPMRVPVINTLVNLECEHFSNIISAEVVEISVSKMRHYTVVLEMPRGQKLSVLLNEQEVAISETLLHDTLTAVSKVLKVFDTAHICHGHINVESIYVDGNYVMLGECVSSLCGFSQSEAYEVIDRAVLCRDAKGETDVSVDYYALGVVALCIIAEINLFSNVDTKQLVMRKLEHGSYSVLVDKNKLTSFQADLVRGLLVDLESRRWRGVQIDKWVRGEKINTIQLNAHNECDRSLLFNEHSHFNRKSLCMDMNLHWDEAKEFVLHTDKLYKWLKQLKGGDEIVFRIQYVVKTRERGTRNSVLDIEDNVLLKTLIILNPTGMIYVKDFLVHINGLAGYFALSLLRGKSNELQVISSILDPHIFSGWFESEIGVDPKQVYGLKESVRYMHITGLGFGLERCLYEMNPLMPCLSPHVLGSYVLSLDSLFDALEEVMNKKEAEGKAVDRHIAAFIASRIGIKDPVTFPKLKNFPIIAHNKSLQMLFFLALMQKRIGRKGLRLLAELYVELLVPVKEALHGRTSRVELQKMLEKAAHEGNLNRMIMVATDATTFIRDKHLFEHAVHEYHRLALEKTRLNNRPSIVNMAYRKGLLLAVGISYLLAALMSIVLIVKTL